MMRLAYLSCLSGVLSAILLSATAWGEDPTSSIPAASRLLPADTLAYARIDDVENVRRDYPTTSLGLMLSDPALKPFASDLYLMLSDLFLESTGKWGGTLDELLAVADGQVAVAVMPGNLSPEQVKEAEKDASDESDEAIKRRLDRKRKNSTSFAFWVMIDAGDNVDTLESLVQVLEERLSDDGYVRRTKEIEGTTLVRLVPPRPGRSEIEHFQREGAIVLGIGYGAAEKSLERWNGTNDDPTLSQDEGFGKVMSRCIGAESTEPQFTFFVDPYPLIGRVIKRFGAGLVLPIVEQLGLGKIRGVGGSSFQGGDFYESIFHLHVLVDPPRDGFFGVLRPKTGESLPPAWVPGDVASYTSIHWDFEKTYENLGKVLERFQGPDPLGRFLEEPVKKVIDVSIKKEIQETLGSRYVTCRWNEPPAKLNSATQVHAIELLDSARATEIIAKLRDKFPERITVDSFGGKVIYELQRRRRRNLPESFRQPEPRLVVLGDWLVFSDSQKFLERMILASSDSLPRLKNDLQYEWVNSELGGMLDGEEAFLVSYMNGSEYIKQIYELAQADQSRKSLRAMGKNNPIASRLLEVLEKHELPPFERFEKYFAPSGTFAYDEPSGMHLGSFTLRGE